MQKLQPKIKELQAKYKDDKQKLNEEMMKFYRENKVNPFGSCLPLLLQMPVFMALYFMLVNQPFETDNSFLWINNIKDPDTILVILYMASQLLSSKLLTAATDRSQQTCSLSGSGVGVISIPDLLKFCLMIKLIKLKNCRVRGMLLVWLVME